MKALPFPFAIAPLVLLACVWSFTMLCYYCYFIFIVFSYSWNEPHLPPLLSCATFTILKHRASVILLLFATVVPRLKVPSFVVTYWRICVLCLCVPVDKTHFLFISNVCFIIVFWHANEPLWRYSNIQLWMRSVRHQAGTKIMSRYRLL